MTQKTTVQGLAIQTMHDKTYEHIVLVQRQKSVKIDKLKFQTHTKQQGTMGLPENGKMGGDRTRKWTKTWSYCQWATYLVRN